MQTSRVLTIAALAGLLSHAVRGFAETWTQTSAPMTNWISVASSAGGNKLVAAAAQSFGPPGPIYVSADSGVTWIQTSAPITNWSAVASSADGSKLIATAGGLYSQYGPIYASADSGATWRQTGAPITNWTAVASSADGTKLVAVAYDVSIYTSTNAGDTWARATDAPYYQWRAVASSADGARLVVAGCICALLQSGQTYVSADSGATWTDAGVPSYEPFVASSADGTRLAFADGTYMKIATSTNGGATWATTNIAPNLAANLIASSADGMKLIAAGDNGSPFIYTSSDSGRTWTSNSSPSVSWTSLASSADGGRLVAVAKDGGIYTSQSTRVPELNIMAFLTNLVISWTVPSMDLELEENSDLSTTNWTAVIDTPALNFTNLEYQVTLSSSGGNRFYRLKSP